MDRSLKYLTGFGLLYVILAVCSLWGYVSIASLNVQLGTIALLYTARIDASKTSSRRYAIAAVLSLLLLYFIPVKAFIYLSLVMAMAFAVESYAGRLNLLPLLVLALMSPIFDRGANLFSFPIRLSITQQVAGILKFFGTHASATGNLIGLDDDQFSVDPACMGLHMFTAALLAGCMLIAFWQRRFSRRLPAIWIMAVLLCIVLLNLMSNLFRMIVLVKFRVLPLTVMHDVMGLSCFLVYLLLPAVWLTRWLVLRFGKEVVDKGLPALATKRRLWPNVLLLLLAAGVVIYAKRELRNDIKVTVPAAIAGYKGEAVPGNVIKLSNEQALIYIKPIAAFYAPEHHPMICWKGSGYQFSQVIEKDHIYQGVLEKASEEPLYTAWW